MAYHKLLYSISYKKNKWQLWKLIRIYQESTGIWREISAWKLCAKHKNGLSWTSAIGFICESLLKGRRAAICTDNVTDVSSKDSQSDSSQFVSSVDSFICQSTIIPADGRGYRMAISSQSISLADTFLGILLIKIRENICLWELVLNYPFCFFAPGATVDTVLDGVNAKPDRSISWKHTGCTRY